MIIKVASILQASRIAPYRPSVLDQSDVRDLGEHFGETSTLQARDVHQILVQYWASVADDGPILYTNIGWTSRVCWVGVYKNTTRSPMLF